MTTSDFDIQFFAEGGEGSGVTDAGGSVTQQAGGSLLSSNPGSVTQQTADQVTQQVAQTQGAAVTQQPGQPLSQQAASQAPDTYQPFTLPEGIQADAEQMQAASTLFKEMGLTQEQAQKLVDFHSKNWMGAVEAQEQLLRQQVAEWERQTKANPEFGGMKLDASIKEARHAIAKLGGEALLKALNETGAGAHPEIFGAFVRIGRLFGEDSFVAGQAAPGIGASNNPSDMAAKVYPFMKRN